MPEKGESILKIIDSISIDSFEDDDLKQRGLEAAQALCRRLEDPRKFLARWLFYEPHKQIAMRVAIDINLFQKLSEGHRPATVSQLAALTQVDPTFLSRLMRMLGTFDAVKQLDNDTYDMTALSHTLMSPAGVKMVRFANSTTWTYAPKVPRYFERVDYKDPTDGDQCPWQHSMDTKLNYFEWLREHPQVHDDFNDILAAALRSRPHWASWYPSEKLFDIDDETSTFLVDVGGSVGHDIEGFRAKHPTTEGRLVLQDLVRNIENADTGPGVESMVHDFFTPQPVHGARVYFLHSILHDWPDQKCKEILLNLKPAMRKGYSKILVHDHILPVGCTSGESAGMDLFMMCILAAKERTVQDWASIFESVGMRNTATHTNPKIWQSIMEVELVE